MFRTERTSAASRKVAVAWSLAALSGPLFALAAALPAAAPAEALPTPCTASNPNCQIVLGMQDGVQGQSCTNWTRYTYGFDPSGGYLACVSYDGGNTGRWSSATTISAGAKQVGSSCCPAEAPYCPTGWGTLGQAVDGRPMYCSNMSGAWAWAVRPGGNFG